MVRRQNSLRPVVQCLIAEFSPDLSGTEGSPNSLGSSPSFLGLPYHKKIPQFAAPTFFCACAAATCSSYLTRSLHKKTESSTGNSLTLQHLPSPPLHCSKCPRTPAVPESPSSPTVRTKLSCRCSVSPNKTQTIKLKKKEWRKAWAGTEREPERANKQTIFWQQICEMSIFLVFRFVPSQSCCCKRWREEKCEGGSRSVETRPMFLRGNPQNRFSQLSVRMGFTPPPRPSTEKAAQGCAAD